MNTTTTAPVVGVDLAKKRLYALRGCCRGFGIGIAPGTRAGVEQIARVLADPQTPIPGLLRGTTTLLVEEIRLLEARISQLERGLTVAARQSPPPPAGPSISCVNGPWPHSSAPITTKPPVR